MVLPLFVSVVDLNEERIVRQESARHHRFVEIRQSFRPLVDIQQLGGVEIVDDLTLIIDEVDVEFSAILITERKNVALVVLLDEAHFEIISIVVVLEDELVSGEAEAQDLVVHVALVTDGHSVL